jgi:hypothetical protein
LYSHFFRTHEKSKKEFKCKLAKDKSLIIELVHSQAKAWIGVKDLNKKRQDREEIFETYVKKLVRHPYSYRGGATYGTFGGYDISLAKFRSAVPRAMGQPACLPTPSFTDEGVKAGRDV